jgi:hypothetical protein
VADSFKDVRRMEIDRTVNTISHIRLLAATADLESKLLDLGRIQKAVNELRAAIIPEVKVVPVNSVDPEIQAIGAEVWGTDFAIAESNARQQG